MKKQKPIELNFIVDKLTNSIENTISGDSFQTDVLRFSKTDLKQVSKKHGWNFNWKTEFDDLAKEVYKLVILSSPNIIQGVVSLSIESGYVLMNLLESAPFNIGKNKLYEGVAGNLVAYACKIAFQRGFYGHIAFDAKTNLIDHYVKTLDAYHVGGSRMIIYMPAAKQLVEKYFKDKIIWDT